jgi:anti-anti-sigma factor
MLFPLRGDLMDKPELVMSAEDVADDTVVIVVSGNIDYSNHGQLRALAGEALGRGRLRQILDLSGVRLCDPSGLAALVAIHRRAEEQGGRIRLVAPSPLVVNVLALTSLDQVFEIRPTVESAVADA